MPPLYPPDYPYRPDAPLLSFGPAFSEDLARSTLRAIWHENPGRPHETDIRSASGLTMLEAFHPRDQFECMLAAQGVAAHCAVLDSFRRALHPDTPDALVIKYRANAVQLGRMFSTIAKDLEHRQAKPLPERPAEPPSSPPDPPPPDPPPSSAAGKQPRRRRDTGPTTPAGEPATRQPAVEPPYIPERPEDLATRPDGTPGNLLSYAPDIPTPPVIPREAPIMLALATRPKPWRMVNVPKDQSAPPTPPPAGAEPAQPAGRGPLDLTEPMFAGDALARFAATRFDPAAPPETLPPDPDESVVELELISTGGDPEAEAHKAAMMAAHPDGRPVVVFRHGGRQTPVAPAEPATSRPDDETPSDT